jgi:hypothetical protein
MDFDRVKLAAHLFIRAVASETLASAAGLQESDLARMAHTTPWGGLGSRSKLACFPNDRSGSKKIREWGNVSAEIFRDEIAPENWPAVLRGSVKHWPAVRAGLGSPRALCSYLSGFEAGRALGARTLRNLRADDTPALN